MVYIFTVEQSKYFSNIFPPFIFIRKVLQKTMENKTRCIMVLPIGRLECDKTYFCNSLSLHTQILFRLEVVLLFILMNLIHWWSPLWYCHVDRRETLQKPGSSSNATSIFLASWKDSTKKQSIYMAFFSFKRYLYQCQTSVNSVIKFMIKFNLYQNNYRYRALNEARTLLPGSISNVACINRLKLTYFVT